MRVSALGIAGLFLGLVLLPGSVHSAGGEFVDEFEGPTSTLDIVFNLYAGGISFGQAAMSARFQGDTYKATSTLETRGIVNQFWRSKIETAASGLIDEHRVRPARYDSYQTRRSGQRREVTLHFERDGMVSVVANPAYNIDDDIPISDDEKGRALDPLSAVIFLTNSGQANQANPCGAVAPVYDGRRRYDIVFSFDKNVNIQMDNGIYAGPGVVCEVEYRQVGGHLQRVVERGGKMPRIFAWVASFQSEMDPGRHYAVPLRLWAETEFGLVVAIASTVKLDGVNVGRES